MGERNPGLPRLTARQRAVLDLVALGLDNRAIAERLGVGVSAVKGTLSRIRRRLDLPAGAPLGPAASLVVLVGTAAIQPSTLRHLVHPASVAAVLTRGPSHKIVVANDTFRRQVSGRLPDRDRSMAFPELEGRSFTEIADEVYRTGSPFFASEHPARGRDGSRRYLTFVVEAVRDGAGEVDGLVAFFIDWTAHVRTAPQGEAHRLEELRVIEQLPAPVLVVDEGARPTQLNAVARRVFGLDGPGAAMASLRLVVRDPATRRVPKREDDVVRMALAGDAPPAREYLVGLGAGNALRARIIAAPLRDNDQRVRGAVILVTRAGPRAS